MNFFDSQNLMQIFETYLGIHSPPLRTSALHFLLMVVLFDKNHVLQI